LQQIGQVSQLYQYFLGELNLLVTILWEPFYCCCFEVRNLTCRSRTYRTTFSVFVAGQFLTELERHAEAAAQYVRAVELAPAQYDLVLSAATALRHAGHKQRAEQFYRRAAELKPQV
jgi:Tfp pilus assembly protein PilF